MSNIIDGVDRRTNLAGNNRLELLLFRLAGPQLYGINVFKVREAIPCPALTKVPYSHPVIKGMASVRQQMVNIVDLSLSIGRSSLDNPQDNFVILTEYNRSIQGFLVNTVERIINISWSDVLPPPAASGTGNYITAITRIDDRLIQIIDVEQVLAEVMGFSTEISPAVLNDSNQHISTQAKHILVADDSSVARKQIQRTLTQLGIEVTLAKNGREALAILQNWVDAGLNIHDQLALLISDIEMPEMDGYTLTSEIRKDSRLRDLKILLHTSMSGTFNQALVEKVGANKFLPKFSADELAVEVQTLIN